LLGLPRGWEYPTIALPDSERERVRAALGVGITDDRQLFAVFPGHTPGILSLLGTGNRRGSSTQYLPRLSNTWHTGLMDATLVLGQQGRLVIPAEVRAALGLAPGDRLHLHLAGPRLVLERQEDAVAELRLLASDVPKSRSFVEELLAERRLAAATE
jgi:antitoxin PrlF